MMRAIVEKELRQHLKVAALVFLVCSAGMAFMLWPGPEGRIWNPLMARRFQAVTILCSAASGLALGVLQTLPEMEKGLWALLVHRPLSRRSIFFGKAIAGLTLHLLAIGIPLTAATIWTSRPGNTGAPFELALVLPGLADLLAGVGFYFAGMLVGVRSANWFGSRLLPIAAAAAMHMAIAWVPSFGQACVIVAAGAGTLALAAWGAFVRGGDFENTHPVARAALGVSALVGLVLAGAVAVTGIWIYLQRAPMPWKADGPVEMFEIAEDGSVVRIRSKGGATESVVDLAGTPRPDLARSLNESTGNRYATTASFSMLEPLLHDDLSQLARYRRAETITHPVNELSDPSAYWYYAKLRGRYIAFDKNTKLEIGSLGPDGFVPAGAQPTARFPEVTSFVLDWDTRSLVGLAIASTAVWRVDFEHRTIQRTLAPQDEPIVAHCRVYDFRRGPAVPSTLISTTSRLHLLEGGEPQRTLPRASVAEGGSRAISIAPRRGDLQTVRYDPPRPGGPTLFVQYGPDGRELGRHEVVIPPIVYPRQHDRDAWLGAFVPPVASASFIQLRIEADPGGAPSAWRDTFLAFNAAMAVLAALANWIMARRRAMPLVRTILWTAVGGVFGLAGAMLAVALLKWPVRVACDACKKMRVVDRDRCEHCGAAHAPATRDGTEIFEEEFGFPSELPRSRA